MMLKELERQLLALSPIEKKQVIQLLSYEATFPFIQKTPGVCGGSACIRETRIPVWVLVEARQLGITEAQLLDDYPGLSAIDLVNAWNYAIDFRTEIELEIQQNNDVMAS